MEYLAYLYLCARGNQQTADSFSDLVDAAVFDVDMCVKAHRFEGCDVIISSKS